MTPENKTLTNEQLEVLKRIADGEDWDFEEASFINASNAAEVADFLEYEANTIDLAVEYIKNQ